MSETATTPIQGWNVVNDTVDELLTVVREFLKDEEQRAASLNARGSGLTGFVGVILSIAAAVGAVGGGSGSTLHHTTRVVVGILVAVALVLLIAAVIAVVVNVLRPTEGFTVHMDEINRYPTFGYISRERVSIQGDLMKGYITALVRDRERNDSKAKWLGRSYALVCVGLLLVALAGTAATLDRYVAQNPPATAPSVHPVRHGR